MVPFYRSPASRLRYAAISEPKELSMFAHSVRFTIVLALGALMTMSRAEEPKVESLKRALQQNAPEVIRYLKNNNCKNVGVLKFRVKIGDAKATDSAGPINMAIANELELALALSRANDPKNPIGIVRRASEVAATIPGATHLTKDGCAKFFTKTYPLAWGKESVTPEAFLTGLVEVDASLRSMSVTIDAFSKPVASQRKSSSSGRSATRCCSPTAARASWSAAWPTTARSSPRPPRSRPASSTIPGRTRRPR
jgi:hypothetical protein